MHIALIADTFPPLRSSGAVQLRDLSNEFVRQGHTLTVILPSSDLDTPWLIEDFNGVQVFRLRALKTKDINYMRRTINEFLMPFIMLNNLRKSPLRNQQMDGVVWYAPSIFFGPLVNALKKTNKCKAYLIIRDIFPEWAADVGLISRGLAYRFFKMIANYQYSIADVIGIQTRGNEIYFRDRKNCQIEVLQNWLTVAPNIGCSISLARTAIAGRAIFVYAGNMGVAQDMNLLIDLAERLLNRVDIGFLFVGRGSHAQRLQEDAKTRGLFNVVFFDEIDPEELPGLYTQCHIGIVALDPRHKTHNIPGKFLSYMQAGLPVLASINPGNDLEEMILREKVGRVCTDNSIDTLQRMAIDLFDEVAGNTANSLAVSARCKALSAKLFSSEVAVEQIVFGLTS